MFTRTALGGGITWAVDPSDQAAHDWILSWLRRLALTFAAVAVSTRVKGNLGESICFALGSQSDFAGMEVMAPNSLSPFSEISRANIDIMWIDTTAGQESVVVQEVKTTSTPNLSYADQLPKEYSKLFGTDPQFTLRTRLQAAANELELARNHPTAQASRIAQLGGLNAASSVGIVLLPSLVYDSTQPGNADQKMSAVRAAIVAQGWPNHSVLSWAVGLGDIDARFARLRAGLS